MQKMPFSFEVTPTEYPLSREAFRAALRYGQGRAFLQIERFGIGEFETELIDACRRCEVFDRQCEGTRTEWLADMVAASGCRDRAVRELRTLLSSLDTVDTANDGDATQSLDLLLRLTAHGKEQVDFAIETVSRLTTPETNFGSMTLIELGIPGILAWMRIVGGWLIDQQYVAEDCSNSLILEELNEAEQTQVAAAAQEDVRIAAFLDAFNPKNGKQRNGPPQPQFDHGERNMSGADVIAVIESGEPFSPYLWLRNARSDDIEVVYEALLKETDPAKQLQYLDSFEGKRSQDSMSGLSGCSNIPTTNCDSGRSRHRPV